MASFCVTVPSRPERKGLNPGEGRRKECVRRNERRGRGGSRGGWLDPPSLLLCSRSGARSSRREEEQSFRPRVSRTADARRPATRAAISMLINTGPANKLQPCVRRLRSADGRAHAGRPGSSQLRSHPTGLTLVPTVVEAGQEAWRAEEANPPRTSAGGRRPPSVCVSVEAPTVGCVRNKLPQTWALFWG